MDPASITFGIVGVLGVVLQTVQLLKTYVNEANDGKNVATEMLTELLSLQSNLDQLGAFLEQDRQANSQFTHTSALTASTTRYCDKLERLRKVLADKLRGHRTSRMSSLKLPLNVTDHRKTIEELRAFSNCIQFALTTDGCALLSKTATEVHEALEKQQEVLIQQRNALNILETLDDRTSLVEAVCEKQTRTFDEERQFRKRDDVLNWLSPLNHAQKHYRISKPHVHGTGEWLLQMDEFISWRDEPQARSNVLCCYGIQGSGKSVLASLVIDRLTNAFVDGNVVVAYFYFDYCEQGDNEQDYQLDDTMLASLLKQLALTKAVLPEPVLDLHQRMTRQQKQPKQQDLEEALLRTCSEFDRVFFVIDALDECSKSQRNAVLRVLSNISQCSSVSMLITSRPHAEDISKAFNGSHKIVIEAMPSDIKKYVDNKIENSDALDTVDNGFRDLIVERVSQGSHQMFLMAVLQVRAILNEPTVGDMKTALEELPHGLNDALDSTLSRIRDQPDGRRRIGLNTLMWISHAKRPLLAIELSEALAIRSGDNFLNIDRQSRLGVMVDCCMGLVTVDEETSEVRLVHFSVQEYLHANQSVFFPDAESIIAGACITYSLFDVFGEGDGCRSDILSILDLIGDRPFVRYACRYWGAHTRCTNKEEVENLALDLLRSPRHRACSYQLVQFIRGRKEKYWEPKEAASCQPLTLAAIFRLNRLVKRLLDSGEATLDGITSMGSTALIVASSEGNRTMTDHLLSLKADVTLEDWYGTALHCTAVAGKAACIPQLIAAGLSVDFRDQYGRTSLHCATISGQIGTMKVLLELGADANAQCNSNAYDSGCTPLRYAVLCEHSLEVVKLLLENGAKLNPSVVPIVTPIHDAAALNLQDALKLLLSHGLDANAKAANGSTPLHFAACNEHTEVVSILLAHGADINAQSDNGSTPIYIAAECRLKRTLMLLLDNGANPNLETDEQLTALDIALREGFADIALVLVEANAKRGRKHTTTKPLCDFGKDSTELVQQLLLDDIVFSERFHESRKIRKADQMRLIMNGFEIQRSLADEQRLGNDSKVWQRICSKAGCKYHLEGMRTGEDLDRHMKSEHPGICSLYKCRYRQECVHQCSIIGNYSRHINPHPGRHKDYFACDTGLEKENPDLELPQESYVRQYDSRRVGFSHMTTINETIDEPL